MPSLRDVLFVQDVQLLLVHRLLTKIREMGIVKAMPLYGTLPTEDGDSHKKGHQTSQNMLKNHEESSIDTLRFDYLADDLDKKMKENDPLFLTWFVLWILYVSPVIRAEVVADTRPELARAFFQHFDDRMSLYVTGSIDYTDRTKTQITTVEAPTAVSKEWHLFEQFSAVHP